MRTIDAIAASAGLLACLMLGKQYAGRSDDLAAEAWLLERGLDGLLTQLSAPFELCYALTLPPGDHRTRMILAASCYGAPSPTLASD